MNVVACYYDTNIFFRFNKKNPQSGNQAPMHCLNKRLLENIETSKTF